VCQRQYLRPPVPLAGGIIQKQKAMDAMGRDREEEEDSGGRVR